MTDEEAFHLPKTPKVPVPVEHRPIWTYVKMNFFEMFVEDNNLSSSTYFYIWSPKLRFLLWQRKILMIQVPIRFEVLLLGMNMDMHFSAIE